MPSRQPHKGSSVAHSTLDDTHGAAKSGVVEDILGDEESGIVIMRNEDGEVEGYDRREIVPLIGSTYHNPVLLRPRHFVALLKQTWGALSVGFAVIAAVALVIISRQHNWSAGLTILVGVGLIVVVGALVMADQASLRRREQKHE